MAEEKAKSAGEFRRTWDKEEYAKRAKQKDEEAKERAKENEEYLKKGQKPPRRAPVDLPKPTELMKARDAPLELEKDVNKSFLISGATGGKGPGAPGWYCEVCQRTCKDSVGYLDHINGRNHLRRLGQSTKLHRSTLSEVKSKIATLRAQTAQQTQAKKYDFESRLKEIKENEDREREERREKKKEKKRLEQEEQEKERRKEIDGTGKVGEKNREEREKMEEMMGFGSFGGGGKKR